MKVAKGKAMIDNVDPRRAATALIEEYGFEAAAAYAVNRISELHDQENLYELSVWREIRKAIADVINESDYVENPDDDRRG